MLFQKVKRIQTMKKETVNREIGNLKCKIDYYEETGCALKNPKSMPMRDIAWKYEYELNKIRLSVYGKNPTYDTYIKLRNSSYFGCLYDAKVAWDNIRKRACCVASEGRTLKATELSQDELVKAREKAIELTNDYIEKYREEVAS